MEKKIIAIVTDFREDKYVLCWLPERRDFANLNDFKDRVKHQNNGIIIDWKVPAQRWSEVQLVLFF